MSSTHFQLLVVGVFVIGLVGASVDADVGTTPGIFLTWDLNGDGPVGASDLAILLASWGPCPD